MIEEEKKLIKSIECIKCDRFFECVGKPRGVEQCVQFVPRKENK